MLPLTWVVLTVCGIAVVSDVRVRRIPNYLTLGLAATAFIAHAREGWSSLLVSLLMFIAVMFIGLPAFSVGWLGGGDVKLAAAAAAALGYPDTVAFLLYMSIGGGLFAMIYAAAKGRVALSVRNVGLMLRPIAFKGTVAVTPATRVAFPYATAIAAGVVAVALSHTVAPFLRLPL
jgi:Flp pilus assembly protein protease CpaA